MTTCTACNQAKEASEFYLRPSGKPRSDCKACTSAYNKAKGKLYYAKNREAVVARQIANRNKAREADPERYFRMRRNRILKSKYGITLEEYDARLAKQGGACLICRSTDPKSEQGVFVVDHCHTSGKVRGLLCVICNIGLGGFRDSRDSLLRAIDYLNGALDYPETP